MMYTGVMHMHSTHSYDGKLTLSELKSFLQARGVSVCCMTEHTDEMTAAGAAAFVAECRALSDQSFVFVPGFEVPYQDAHVLHVGTTRFFGQTADAAQLSVWRDATPLVVLAHPVRNRFVVDEHLLRVLDGVEVWNQQYEGKAAPRFRSLVLLQTLQTDRPGLLATGGLDFHRVEHFGTPQLELELDELSEAAVVAALKAGAFKILGPAATLSASGTFVRGGGLTTRFASATSILIITFGKLINRGLARFGLRVPRAIRARV